MKRNEPYLCWLFAVVCFSFAGVSCSSSVSSETVYPEEAVLENIFARKSVRSYLNKGVE